ncbi:MAG: hypothetical protein MUE61_21995 [Vicinamibacterales bacterium]|nr:hypothetical protein [Vicinamibacterales bacterium]
MPISSRCTRHAASSSSGVTVPSCHSSPKRSANASSSACWMAGSPGVAVPSSSRSVTTRWAAESSWRFSSLARGTRSAATIAAGSMSTSTVPW